MNPKLLIIENELHSYRKKKNLLSFIVIDRDNSNGYPSNFVCTLPENVRSLEGTSRSKFYEIFRERSEDTAKALLNEALETEVRPDFLTEVRRRIDDLQPKSKPKSKCVLCGKIFEARKFGRFKERICQSCQKKR